MKLYIVHTFTRPTIKPAKSILRVQKGLGYVQPEYQSFVKRVDSIIIESTYSLAKVTAPDFVNLQIIILNKIRFSPWPIDIRHSIPILDLRLQRPRDPPLAALCATTEQNEPRLRQICLLSVRRAFSSREKCSRKLLRCLCASNVSFIVEDHYHHVSMVTY